jgi:uncharacterized protein (UPF0548 family)
MLSVLKPSTSAIHEFLETQAKLTFSYPAVGATATVPPAGYSVDHTRVKLGDGERVFSSAKAALGRWDHFHLGWVEAYAPETPVEPGNVVAVLAHHFGLWWLNACRIVYVVDEPGPIRRFGYAYGTLPDHVESGEERFLVEWDEATGAVWYDILAFSRPRHRVVRLAKPFARRVQKRFARDSAAAMARAVRESRAPEDGFSSQATRCG